jgi:putative addiction module killer protein
LVRSIYATRPRKKSSIPDKTSLSTRIKQVMSPSQFTLFYFFMALVFPIGYNLAMKYTLESTVEFDRWFSGLKDGASRSRILARLNRVENGNFGDHKLLAPNLFELRLFFGPGWRVYYTIRNSTIILLLTGGEKSSQTKDIAKAGELLKLEE